MNREKFLPSEARRAGYRPLTTAYTDSQEWMLRRAIKSLEGCDVVLVVVGPGEVEIWRASAELKDINDDEEVD